MRGNRFVALMAFIAIVAGFDMLDFGVCDFDRIASGTLYADDGGKKPDGATPEKQTLEQQWSALYDTGIMGRHSNFGLNYCRLRDRISQSSNDANILADVRRRYDDLLERRKNLISLIFNDTAMMDPSNVARGKAEVKMIKTDAEACEKDYFALLTKYYPASTIIEPLYLEFREACDWRGGYVRDNDLRTMYALADTGSAYTEEDKKALDDLAVRYYHGDALESALWKLFQTDGAMDKPANVEKVKQLLPKFKKVVNSWDGERHRLWHKAFDLAAIAAHEQRIKNAAKALESADEKPEATPPK